MSRDSYVRIRGRRAPADAWPRRLLDVVAGVLLFNLGASAMLWQVERFALKPYRIPSSAMEPTLHCPRPAPGCRARVVTWAGIAVALLGLAFSVLWLGLSLTA